MSRSPNTQPVAITGIGLVTPLGDSAWETVRALLEGRTTADRLANLPENVDPVAIARATAGSRNAVFDPVDPAVALAERAAREALSQSGVAPESVLTVLASSKGAISPLLKRPTKDGALSDRTAECAALSPHGYLAHHLRRRLGLGEIRCPVAACATSVAALELALRALRTGEAERALVVGVESALHSLFVWSYKRLGVLAPVSPAQAHVARPLDRERDGFTLCETAAAIVIEREPSVRVQGHLLRATIGTEPDAFVRPPEGLPVTAHVERALRGAPPLSLIHPHATGTKANDARELEALARVVGDRARSIPLYASKGALGHPLGAAALVNVVLGLIFARVRSRPPMPWLGSPIESAFPIERKAIEIGDGPQLALAAGFGGHVGAVLFAGPHTEMM